MLERATVIDDLPGRRHGKNRGLAKSANLVARLRRSVCGFAVGCFAAATTPSPAHPLSLQECFEGGDFIAHAAEARDNGITKTAFCDKLVADIYLIQAFPRELRWFVQDPDDGEFLLAEATRVFDRPEPPEAHRTQFLARCFDRKLGINGAAPSGSGAGTRGDPESDSAPRR